MIEMSEINLIQGYYEQHLIKKWHWSHIPYVFQKGYGVMVLNPNENYLDVEKPAKSFPLPSPTEPSDEPAEKRERKDEKEGKKKREFYEKYRNPQKETETERIPIRVSVAGMEDWQRREGEGRHEGSIQRAVAEGQRDRYLSKTDMIGKADGGTV